MRPLFRYILSNILREMEEENLVRITIRVHLISGEDHEKRIIYSEYFEDNFFYRKQRKGVLYTSEKFNR